MRPRALPVIGLIQLAARSSLPAAALEDLLVEKTRQAAERGADLVLFPAYLGLMLLERGWDFDRPGEALEAAGAGAARRAYLEAAGRAAQAAGVHLVPGSMLEAGRGGWVHAAYLFSPRGEALGRRVQVHVSPCDRRRGLVGGDAIETVTTPWGPVGLLLGTDAYYPETARILRFQGTGLLLAPAAHPAPASAWQRLAGLWREAQANEVHAAEACLGGELGGRRFEGASVVYGPNEVTPGESGVLARAGEGEDILVVRINPHWEDGIRRYRILELMRAGVYARCLPPAYRQRGEGS